MGAVAMDEAELALGVLGIMHDRILAPRLPTDRWSGGSVEWAGVGRLLIRCDRSTLENFLQVPELEKLDAIARSVGLSEIGAIEEPSGAIYSLFPLPGIAPDAECNDGE